MSHVLLTEEQAQQIDEVLSGMLHGTDWNNGTHAKIYRPKFPEALAAIRAARAQEQAEQEPVGIVDVSEEWGIAGVLVAELPIGIKLYTAPPQREWVEPSDEQITQAWLDDSLNSEKDFARAVLKLAKELNHG